MEMELMWRWSKLQSQTSGIIVSSDQSEKVKMMTMNWLCGETSLFAIFHFGSPKQWPIRVSESVEVNQSGEKVQILQETKAGTRVLQLSPLLVHLVS